MDKSLQGIEGVKCIFKDMIVQGACESQLLKHLKNVFDRLKHNNLRVNKDNGIFFEQSVAYLWHTIDKNGLHKHKEKLKNTANRERPTNVNKLRTFLGMAKIYNKFIPNLASMTSPLNELLKTNAYFRWSNEGERIVPLSIDSGSGSGPIGRVRSFSIIYSRHRSQALDYHF